MVEFESAEQAAEAINTLHLSEVGRSQFGSADVICGTPALCISTVVLPYILTKASGMQVDGREIYVRCAMSALQPFTPGAEIISACKTHSSDPGCHNKATQTADWLALV